MVRCSRIVLLALVLIQATACSFYSSQWETAKLLLKSSVTQEAEFRVYWWDLAHPKGEHRLLPVVWGADTILTDGGRWLVVFRGNVPTLIRDLELNRDLKIDYVNLAPRDIASSEIDSFPSGGLLEKKQATRELVEKIVVKESAIDRDQVLNTLRLLCYPAEYRPGVGKILKSCIASEEPFEFSVTTIDQSGGVTGIELRVSATESFIFRRSQDSVAEEELQKFLGEEQDDY
jgi:hypothetical protein